MEAQDNEKVVDWFLVNQLVAPEHQYLDVKEPPLPQVRMAWPFKTEQELRILSKWFKEEEKKTKKKLIEKHVKQFGKAML